MAKARMPIAIRGHIHGTSTLRTMCWSADFTEKLLSRPRVGNGLLKSWPKNSELDNSEIRFSWILLGQEPADEQELLYVYAALLGHAMDLTAQRVSLVTPGLSVGGLTSALQLLEDGQTMRRTGADRGRSEYTPHCGQMRIQKRHF